MTLPRVQPIAPTWHKEPFDDPDWLFDFKYDGFRAVCYLERRRNRLISRNNNIMTRFDALADQVAVSAVVLAFLWGATQWVAWRLAFQPQLGHPWFNILGWPVSDPPAIFWWWFAYDAYARPIFVEGAYIVASGGIAAVVVAIAMSVWRAREVKKVTTYGSARWAETRAVRLAGLLGHDGVMLGRWRHEYLRHDGPEHVLCFAPTRSGKGVGLVVPTLLTWPESAIVHDIRERIGP